MIVCKKGRHYLTCPKYLKNKHGCAKCRDGEER